jgi:hypothetical protein
MGGGQSALWSSFEVANPSQVRKQKRSSKRNLPKIGSSKNKTKRQKNATWTFAFDFFDCRGARILQNSSQRMLTQETQFTHV